MANWHNYSCALFNISNFASVLLDLSYVISISGLETLGLMCVIRGLPWELKLNSLIHFLTAKINKLIN